MYVCICHKVTDREIQRCVSEGATTVKAVCRSLSCGHTCGKCLKHTQKLVKDGRSEGPNLPGLTPFKALMDA